MTVSAPSATAWTRRPRLRRLDLWILVSATLLVPQAMLVDYGSDAEADGAAGTAIVVGIVLLVLVRLGSRVARGIVVVLSATAAIIYLLASTSVTGFAIAFLFAGQAAALLTPSVRHHVQSRKR